MAFVFTEYRIDPARRELSGPDGPVAVEPQVFDLLVYLIEHRERVVTKQELLEEVWGHSFVSESTLTSRVTAARQAVGDDGRRQELIRTAHGRGYRFVADVEARGDGAATPVVGGRADSADTDVGLVGRATDLEAIDAHLERTRLLTLTGPGGVGKTSLATAVQRRIGREDAAHGCWLVELVPVSESNVAEAVATALEVQRRRGLSSEASLVEVLRSRTGLLILDNCEHLITEVAALVATLLADCPNLSILATSRESLQVRGEQVYPVGPLDWRDDRDGALPAAVDLFAQRAAAADPSFRLDDTNRDVVSEICRRLDGIPLAIELAAARSRSMAPADLAARLDERFRVLTGGTRDSDHRHRTLVDTIAWSHDLLGPVARELFAQISVFTGPFDLAALEAVGDVDGDVLDELHGLVDRSMVSVRRTGNGTRFEVLESLRAFGAARLSDAERQRMAARHQQHYAALAEVAMAGLDSEREAAWVDDLDGAFENLRTAQAHAAASGDLEAHASIISGVREYAMRTMRYEVMSWAAAARGEAPVDDPIVVALDAYGSFVRGEFVIAAATATRARDLESTQGHRPSGLVERVLANCHSLRRDFDSLLDECARQRSLAEESGEPARIAHAAYFQSAAHTSAGNLAAAREAAEVSRSAALASGSPTALAGATYAETLLVLADDADEARRLATRCDDLARSVGNRWMSAFVRSLIGSLDLLQGDLAAARQTLGDVLDVWYRSGDWSHTWLALNNSMVALAASGEAETAAVIIGAVEHHAAIGAAPSAPAEQAAMFDAVARVRDELGDAFERHAADGRETRLGELVSLTRRALDIDPGD